MTKKSPARHTLSHEFVEFVPEHLQEGVLYVSTTYATAAHRCFCGCGREVVTPLSPTDWKLSFDGETVSLAPSVGNWSFPCRSHYWIDGNRVHWCGDLPQQLIDAGRARDRQLKNAYFGGRRPKSPELGPAGSHPSPVANRERAGWWSRLLASMRGE